MRKKFITGLTLALFVTSVGLVSAAPVKNLDDKETVAGYSYYDIDGAAHGIYVEHGLTDRVIIGTEYIDMKHSQKTYDLYGKYKLDQNILVSLGIRDYKDESTKLTVGLEATTPLAPTVDAYAGVKHNSVETEYKLGVGHQLNANWGVDLSYIWHDVDHGGTVNGIGLGFNYSF